MLRSMQAVIAAILVICLIFVQGRNLDNSHEDDSPDDGYECVSGKIENDEFGCCGTTKYNRSLRLCCIFDGTERSSQLVDAKFGNHSFCCSLGVYDDRKYGCCDGLPYNLAGQVCCGGTAIRGRKHGERTACCGLTVYNDADQVCCAGKTLHPRVFGAAIDCCDVDGSSDGRNCCTDTVTGTVSRYNPATHLCCEGSIQQVLSSNSSCCGAAVYDSGTHVCCADTAVGSECCGDSAIGGPSTPSWSCCGGTKAYDMTLQICCDDVVRRKKFDDATGCCGTAVYNATSSACCDGAVQCLANTDDNLLC